MVKHLPAGSKVTVIDGQKYYVVGGTFYQERITANDKLRYEVVGTDGVLNTTNADAEDNDNETAPPPAAQGGNSQEPSNNPIISQLPEGCTPVVINQRKFFVSPSGVYYQEVKNGNATGYKIAGNTTPAVPAPHTDNTAAGT